MNDDIAGIFKPQAFSLDCFPEEMEYVKDRQEVSIHVRLVL